MAEVGFGQYGVEQESRNVRVCVMPGEALLVESMNSYGGHEDPQEAEAFPLEEIRISGGAGEMRLSGQQALTRFIEVSRALYVLAFK